ncbi:Fic family protein [Candidatus Margulisiibacteriota bacterium]
MNKNKSFSDIITVFQENTLPEKNARLAGYAAIIYKYNLRVPLPDKLAIISEKHKKYEDGRWMVFTPRHMPEHTLYNQLIFALKYEGVDLGVLKALFDHTGPDEITRIIKQEPTGGYSRRIWFLYEWLQRSKLALSDAQTGNFVDLLNEKLQYPGSSRPSRRHRVRNNLPGVPEFCPLIRRTPVLDTYINKNLKEKVMDCIGSIHPDVLARASAFLLLQDSKASYAIEGESPSYSRAERWGKVIGQSGHASLSHQEFQRLQKIVISDDRFVKMGYRKEGGFIGTHTRSTRMPMPDHISARWEDVQNIMDGMIDAYKLLQNSDYDAVLAAAAIAFGFVFIHPFEDGNGRIHRYLFHHVLMEKGFTPKGVVFPVSAVILDKIERYKQILESYSRPRLEYIKWRPTDKGNVEVLNETIDLYRYFDATKQAEFFYECVQETIEKILPEEVDYLQKYDQMKSFIGSYIDMPDRMADLLINFLRQGNGKLSKRAIEKEFSSLTTDEINTIEAKYLNMFNPFDR